MKAFDKYVSKFDLNDEHIKAKYNHSYRVSSLCEKYAKELGLSEEDIKLAKVIGLLHDIGRFEQYKQFKSFSDKDTIDHADLSASLLFDQGLIKNFNINPKDYEIVKFAIINHNKLTIPDTDERKLKFAKLIRDTDKIDIIYMLGYLKELSVKTTDEPVSEEILQSIKNHEIANRHLCKNSCDRIAVMFAFAFDINYDVCLKELKRNYKYFYKRLKNKKFIDIYLEVLKYINERTDKDA